MPRNKIFISGAHGSACSLVKSLAIGSVKIDAQVGTCHESWGKNLTPHRQEIWFAHNFDLLKIKRQEQPDVMIWLQIDAEDIVWICRRVVILDFIYAQDPHWFANDWCWTPKKHERLAGPDWPTYSQDIRDYPGWCLDEMCQVAWERTSPWTHENAHCDYTLGTNEFFGTSARRRLVQCFGDLGLSIDHAAIDLWREKNHAILSPYMSLFSWDLGWQTPTDWVTKHLSL